MPGHESAPRRRDVTPLLAGALLLIYALASATSVRQQSITFDELAHLTGGMSSWIASDYRLFPQNGQFAQRWAALPLVVHGFRFPSLDQSAWWTSDLEAVGYQFLYGVGNDHDALLWRARLAMISLGALLGFACYVWARRLFGRAAGLVALFVFAFSPSMLAHGPLATSDISAALMFTIALGAFWLVLHRASAFRVLGSALAMGVLFTTKMSAPLMVPVALIMTAIRIRRGRPLIWAARQRRVVTKRQHLAVTSAAILAAHAVGVVIVIWASYGFRYATFQDGVPGRDRMFLGESIDTLVKDNVVGLLITHARNGHVLPEPFLFGLAHVLNRSGRLPGFLNGHHSMNGWWYFFPYCWAVKTPLSIFALLGLAAAAWRPGSGSNGASARWRRASYRLTPLWVFLAVYWTAAMLSDLNLGERHLLPTYPAVFILTGGAASQIGKKQTLRTVAVGLLLLSLSIESIRIRPHYLAYFNAFAGGPASGYRHLVDSSLDWGQDLPGLRRWLQGARRESGLQEPVYLSYFGSGDPRHYGIDARQLFSYQDWRRERAFYELTGGIYCISATMLQGVYTRARGHWSVPYEAAYQRARLEIERLPAMTSQPAAGAISGRDATAWRKLASDFDELRLARLCAYLRRRKPDDQVGYSILIYRLSDEDVQQALSGPPAELWPVPRIEGVR
jgi:hypothetical protein